MLLFVFLPSPFSFMPLALREHAASASRRFQSHESVSAAFIVSFHRNDYPLYRGRLEPGPNPAPRSRRTGGPRRRASTERARRPSARAHSFIHGQLPLSRLCTLSALCGVSDRLCGRPHAATTTRLYFLISLFVFSFLFVFASFSAPVASALSCRVQPQGKRRSLQRSAAARVGRGISGAHGRRSGYPSGVSGLARRDVAGRERDVKSLPYGCR